MESVEMKTRLPLLNDDNFTTWMINIRAILRQKKLWEVIQEPIQEGVTKTQIAKYEEAADILTPTISPAVQHKLTEQQRLS